MSGGITKWKTFLRGEGLEQVIEHDVVFLTGHYYIHMIENGKQNIKQIFEYISERLAYGGIIYNCFAGKDRTGVLTALLLLLCGVSELDVLADYMVSSVYLRTRAEILSLSNDYFSSNPEFMEEFLTYFKQKHKSAEQYLLSVGVSPETMANIKKQFIQQL